MRRVLCWGDCVQVAGGNGLKFLVSIDAVIVLAGGVLTAYVVRALTRFPAFPVPVTQGSVTRGSCHTGLCYTGPISTLAVHVCPCTSVPLRFFPAAIPVCVPRA